MKLKKNDNIKIISGKDRGKTGKVLKVFPEDNKILAEGLNLFKKHVKPKKQNQKGEVILSPRPFNSSKAMIICSSCQKITRIGYQFEDNEKGQEFSKKKIRICKKCNSRI